MLAAQQLDRRISLVQTAAANVIRPKAGWIRAIRDALGLTAKQLSARLGVTQPRITELEHAEARGVVTLNTLERTAEALGCKFVYYFVPIEPLAVTLEQRAEKLAGERVGFVQHNMRLEDQAVTDLEQILSLKEDVKRQLLKQPARLWD